MRVIYIFASRLSTLYHEHQLTKSNLGMFIIEEKFIESIKHPMGEKERNKGRKERID
jgi:hypothetical protein